MTVDLCDKADVLVIGAGAAGLMAAVKARENGADVLVGLKSAGCSTDRSGGGLAMATEGYSVGDHARDTVESGRFIGDESFIKILTEEAPERFKDLCDYGLRVQGFHGYVICAGGPVSARGSELTRALRSRADDLQVRWRPGLQAVDLIVQEGRVSGLLAFDENEAKLLFIESKSVVLATGGAGGLYAKTDNDPRNTGDGYAMAYRAGLKLRDMEFVQFYPLGVDDQRLNAQGIGLFPPNLADVGEIRNASGENLLEKHQLKQRPVAIKARDLLSRAIFLEIQAGNDVGGCVLLDLTGVDDERWPKDHATLVYKEAFREVLKCAEKPVLTTPVCHFFIGGVAIGADGSTGIDGLYVAGETGAGVHGANRMGRNALTDAVVFGARAGESASRFAASEGSVKASSESISALADRRIRLGKQEGSSPAEVAGLMEKIRDVMWRYVGVVRDADGLRRALQIFAELKRAVEAGSTRSVQAASASGLLEVENALLVGEMVARSALLREESRGAHFRKDFPREAASWKRNLFVRKSGDQMIIT
jgi:fumarate reductase (CoM/CoB) subunit A